MSTQSSPEIIEQNGQKFALVSTIKTIETNREFHRNVQVVQQQRAVAIELKKRHEQALTDSEKQALKKKLDETVKSLDGNNALMAKTYGFSLLRNYLIRFLKTRLYTPLTDEEFAKMPAEEKAKPEATKTIDGKLHAFVAAIEGTEANDQFRQNVQLVQTQRNRLVQLKQAIEKAESAEEKAKVEEDFKKSEEVLVKNNEEMVKRYGFSLMRNYFMEVEESKLYIAVTEEEAKKVGGQPAAPAA